MSFGTFRDGGDLNEPRFDHSATLLEDGRVLVIGGSTGYLRPSPRSAELWDPRTELFTVIEGPSIPRLQHTATRLLDGRVLVCGGVVDGVATASIEIFDPVKCSFSKAIPMSAPREGHTASMLENGCVLVAGGEFLDPSRHRRITLGSSECWNPARETWTPAGELAEPRTRHVAVPIGASAVLVVGGKGRHGGEVSLYELWTGDWSVAGRGTGRWTHAATLIALDEVLVVGGRTKGTIIGRPERWSRAEGIGKGLRLRPRAQHTVNAIGDGRALIIGGSPGGVIGNLPSADLLNFGRGTSVVGGILRQGRASHTATRLLDGRILVIGGVANLFDPVATTELWCPG